MAFKALFIARRMSIYMHGKTFINIPLYGDVRTALLVYRLSDPHARTLKPSITKPYVFDAEFDKLSFKPSLDPFSCQKAQFIRIFDPLYLPLKMGRKVGMSHGNNFFLNG